MDAFENLVAMLLKRDGYWTSTSFKVELTRDEKRKIKRHSTPRWEVDVVAYKGSENELLAVECKSFLDSTGVVFRNGRFAPEKRYKLFSNAVLREVVLTRLCTQLEERGSCAPAPTVRLCLAAGKVARKSDLVGLRAHFSANGWRLFEKEWFERKLCSAADSAYENDVAHVVAKLLMRRNKCAPATSKTRRKN